MRSMTFQIDDRSTDGIVPAVLVTITEREDGTLAFTITVLGEYTGDLRGFFFDLADESLIGTLSVAPDSGGLTEFRQADDGVLNLGAGSNLQGLAGSDGGYDAGIEIGSAGIGADDYQSFSFTLSSTERALTLEDFSGVDFGVRLTSVGEIDGSRDAGAKLLETTSSAIDARDDANEVHEDSPANPVTGNVFANDLHLAGAVSVTAIDGSAAAVGADLQGLYGTLRLNADGTYAYTLDNTRSPVQALGDGDTLAESFRYTATRSDEATSSSSDSALLTITIVGANDAPDAAPVLVAALEDVPLSGVLSAFDPEGDSFTFELLAAPEHGTVSVASDGSFTYAPAENFSGPDAFSYVARDVHGAAGTAFVSLDVIAVADAPTLAITESTGGDSGEFAITQDDPFNQSGIAPRIAALDDGGFVVTWSSFGAGGSDVFATIFDAAGSSAQTFQVSADDPTDQQYDDQQAVTQLADGNLAFIWRNLDGFSLAEDVVVRLFDPEGAPISGEIFVESVFSSIPETLEPQVAPFGDGFVAIWTAQPLFDFSSDVFGQVLDASGQEIGGPFQISAPGLPGGLHVARDGSVAALADGGFVVLYTEVGDFSQGVYGQRYDASAAPIGPLFAVMSDFSADAPDVAGLPDGGFVASWNSFDPASGSFDIRAQRFGPDGAPSGGAITVSVDEPGAFGQEDFGSSIAATSDGGFAVAWSGFRLSEDGTEDWDVFFRRFAADGSPLDDEIRLNQNDLSFNFGPDVAGLSGGAAAATWYADSGFLGATKGRVIGGDEGLITSPGVPIALNIVAALTDTDGSEFLTLTISGVPAGGMLSAGADNGDGSWSLALEDLEGLTFTPPPDSGEDVTLTVTATATELSNGDQASTSQSLTIVVNSAPDITGGDTSGLAYEDGARVARGQLAATDADGTTPAWSIGTTPMLGFASVDDGGAWTYVLDNFRFEVQSLAQDETRFDTFTVRARDDQGASDSQEVTIEISGTNDRPFITTPPGFGALLEDGEEQSVTGQAFAFDPDSDAGPATWSLSRGTAFGYGADYHVTMDAFRVARNGVLIFEDEFNNGAPPPSAPAFINGPAANYVNVGGVFAEDAFAGRLIMDGSGAVSFPGYGYPDMDAGHSAILSTNTDSANTTNGLKIGHDFVVEAVFDFTLPDQEREGYGFQLTDAFGEMGLLGDDRAGIAVRRVDGEVYVTFASSDAVADLRTVVGSQLLDPSAGDQILLRLEHDNDNPGVITASYEYLSGGVGNGGGVLGTAMIFGRDTPGYAGDDENWTRAQLLAFGPESFEGVTNLQGDYGSLSIDQTGAWTYELDNDAPQVQALGAGQIVFDTFHLRATDQYGLSSSQPLFIPVEGSSDGGVTVLGTPEADTLVGSAFDDVLVGGGGSDLLSGLEGPDRFDFDALDDGVDTITDFEAVPGGDMLDIRDLLEPSGAPLDARVRLEDSGDATTVWVNPDGFGEDFAAIARLEEVTGLTLDDFWANGNLIV